MRPDRALTLVALIGASACGDVIIRVGDAGVRDDAPAAPVLVDAGPGDAVVVDTGAPDMGLPLACQACVLDRTCLSGICEGGCCRPRVRFNGGANIQLPELVCSSVVAGHFNRDGDIDVALVCENEDGSVPVWRVHLNDGMGTLFSGQPVNTALGRVRDAVVGDFNGDGALDIAAVGDGAGGDAIELVAGGGDGTLRDGVRFRVTNDPRAIVAADVDGDGLIDLVTAHPSARCLQIHIGTGTGFVGPQTWPMGNEEPIGLAAGAFVAGGPVDLVTANLNGSASILRGRGDGTFEPPETWWLPAAASSVDIGDFDGDGRRDFAVIHGGGPGFPGVVSAFFDTGAGFSDAARFDVAAGVMPSGLTAVDFDLDGRDDLGLYDAGHAMIGVILGRQGGALGARMTYAATPNVRLAIYPDLNADGRRDLVAVGVGFMLAIFNQPM